MNRTPNLEIPELLDRARAGDAAAMERLFAFCRSYVAIAAKAEMASWLRAKVDASDLVQQTMLEAHRGLKNFRGRTEAEWLTWLRRILAHNAADFVRQYHGVEKRSVGREVPLVASDESGASERPLAAGDPTPSQLLISKERELKVADAVAKLPDDYQDVIILRNMQRLPFEEVAQRMGRSRPAVQMLWMRAIRQLQGILGSEAPSVE